ncbi:PAS domain-containing protein [Sphingomonas sp. PR090111-T3T-6A]|uniref:PAS domain-containing protein n=1 Tax=Sphingomonas sp. PR090111-T3T-6A TaxID=685778 RepID=UPI0005697328|nr:PAS domain-containing protein [Sphingomonas sp. PR090111-T3T-6A]
MAVAGDKESRRKIELDDVVDALPALVWTTTPDGRCDFSNRRWCGYTGLNDEEALGHGWQAALHPDDLRILVEGLDAMAQSGIGRDMEARLRRADGEYRWFLLRPSPLPDAGGGRHWC